MDENNDGVIDKREFVQYRLMLQEDRDEAGSYVEDSFDFDVQLRSSAKREATKPMRIKQFCVYLENI